MTEHNNITLKSLHLLIKARFDILLCQYLFYRQLYKDKNSCLG